MPDGARSWSLPKPLGPTRPRLAAWQPDGVARWTLYLVASAYLLVLAGLATVRVPYAFELEWMEGGSLQNVQRVMSGQPLYVRPSLEFIPFLYTPLYYYVSAALAFVLGDSFLTLRLVSFLSAAGTLALIFLLVRRETGHPLAGFLAAGLFAATFRISGAWFDLARVDSLFVFLLVGAVYALRFPRSGWWYAGAGLLTYLAFMTKQTALPIALPLLVYLLLADRRGLVLYAGTLLPLVLVTVRLLDGLTQGWFSYYTLYLPRQHELVPEMFLNYWTLDLLRPLGLALSLAVFDLAYRLRRAQRSSGLFYLSLATGAIGATWVARLHSGGWDNVLLPPYAVISILFGLAVHRFYLSRRGQPGPAHQGQPGPALPSLFVPLMALLQFAALAYNPLGQIPAAEDAQAGRALVRWIERQEGDVFVPYHGYLAARTGRPSYAHGVGINDVLRGSREDPVRTGLILDLLVAIRQQRFEVIVLDAFDYRPNIELHGVSELAGLQGEIAQFYDATGGVFDDLDSFWPVTGVYSRPAVIYRARLP